jgi:hypothetical protein
MARSMRPDLRQRVAKLEEAAFALPPKAKAGVAP